MIKIAVCDDSKIDLELISYLIDEYVSERTDIEFKTVSFSNAFKLMEYVENPSNKEKFDIYLLDVIMNCINGIELGSFIRRHDKDCHIIYITAYTEYALVSYDVIASGYIVKPVSKDKLFQTLDRVISKISDDVNCRNRISVKTKDGIQNIMFHNIVYAEYSEHIIRFHLLKGNVISSSIGSLTITKLWETLENEGRFVNPHRAFIVNLQYVKNLKGNFLFMNTGEEIPISRTSLKAIKDKYMNFSKINLSERN